MNQAARLAPALRGLRAVTIPASSFGSIERGQDVAC
jgi:hypothetical protein